MIIKCLKGICDFGQDICTRKSDIHTKFVIYRSRMIYATKTQIPDYQRVFFTRLGTEFTQFDIDGIDPYSYNVFMSFVYVFSSGKKSARQEN